MSIKSLWLFGCLFVFAAGCGASSSDTAAPSGNELQQYLAEHPEINEAPPEPEEVD